MRPRPTHTRRLYCCSIFANNSPRAEVKLIDFGLSQVFGKDEMTEGVGTIYTMAPEVLKGSYTKQADLWSIGVIAYVSRSSLSIR